MIFSGFNAEVLGNRCCKFHQNWTGLRVHYLPPDLAFLFGTIQYIYIAKCIYPRKRQYRHSYSYDTNTTF